MRIRVFAAAVLGLGLVFSMPASAQKDTLRPAVGKPLQEAQKLVRAKKFKDALAPIAEAEQVADLSAYEAFIVAQMKGSALAGAGDANGAALAFEQVLAAKRLPRDEQLAITEAVAGTYLRARNYPKAIEWLQAYKAEGGTKPEVLALLAQAHYFAGDYAKAANEAAAQVARVEQAGGKPGEDLLKLLASSQQKQNDMAGYARTLETMVRHYPTPAYWADVIRRTAARPGFSRQLDLDMYRLLRATGNLAQAKELMDAAQLAVLAGLPGEAKALLDEGYAKQVLGSGEAAQIERQHRLRVLVEKKYAEDRKIIASTDADAANSASGDPLLKTGLAYVTYGDAQKGVPMMEQGLRKGGLKFAAAAQLHLGYAYRLAGQKDKALAAFAGVQGGDGAADLARLWRIIVEQDRP